MENANRADKIAEIVEQALDVAIGERGALILKLCGDDQELFVEVASLLQFQEKARDFIEKPAVETIAEVLAENPGEFKKGDSLDHYQIVARIGEGGMGEVYLAEDTSLGRKVALKLLHFGMGTTNIVRRFHEEERILAGLTHPNIAQLYGGGVISNGIPYFAMEYVDGTRVDDYCRERQLSLHDRLELFRKVCAAVSYAHQRLIIHRDLKPANIRVTADGEPKLLDFGIAKLIDPSQSIGLEATMTFASAMTPEYASPEQIRGDPMTTASDVYSLGVVLYELLTEQKPYQLDRRSPTAIARAITEQEPTRPSIAVARQEGNSKSGPSRTGIRNPKFLRGDLDNIILKALRKEPERRYASVAQFSEDIRRHLERLPVSARKDTLRYRASKFVGRNKFGVAAAAIILLSLVGGMVATAWEAHLANGRFNQVRRLANSLMFEIHDSVKDLQGSTPTRRLIVSRALEYLDSLAHDAGRNASLQRELATVYEKIGDIQGNPYSANLGDTDGALASYRKAMTIRETLSQRDSSLEAGLEMGRSYRALGDIFEQKGDIKQCVGSYRRSLSIFQELAEKYPSEFSAQDELARAYETLADGLHRAPDNNGEREEWFRKSLSLRQNLLSHKSGDPKLRRSVALSFLKLGRAMDSKKPESIQNTKRALEMLEALSTQDPNNGRAYREVGFGYYELGNALSEAGDYSAALDARRKAFAIRQEIAAADPKNAQARFDLAEAHADLADALSATGASKSALDHAGSASSIFHDLVTADPTNAVYQRNLALCYELFGEIHARLGDDDKRTSAERISDWGQARDSYQRAADSFSALSQRGVLMPADSEQPKKFKIKAHECETQLAQLQKGH